VLDEAGQPDFADQAGIRALEYYCNLRQFCPTDTHTYGNAEIAEVIKKGQAALVTTWGGQSAAIVLAEDNAFKDLYHSAVFPKPWNATWGVSIPTNHPQACQAEMLSILLQAAGPKQDRVVTHVAGSPVRQSSYTPEALKRYHQWLPAQYQMLRRAGVLPVDHRTGAYLGILYKAIYSAFTNKAATADALQKAADEVKAILEA
jgi:ABC-type glycerol-3-phosphate transport system substrate-binding protein